MKKRFKDHISEAINKNGHINKFHSALLFIGISHFKVELIGQFDKSIIDQKEIEYIQKYDSYYNGYNSTLGGHSGKRNEYDEEIENSLIKLYESGYSIESISKDTGISKRDISNILKDKKIQIRDGCKTVFSIDKYGNILKFNSITDAYKHVCIKYENARFADLSHMINVSNKSHKMHYGYIWVFSYEDACNISNELKKSTKIKSNKSKCEICGKIISARSSMCIDCYTQCNSKKPDKETLKSLISEYSYEAVGRMYNVSGKTVRKWCDKYDLVESRERDSSGVTCVELDIHFKTFKEEAAEYLVNNGYSNANNIKKLAYKISQAKKNNKECNKFNWE